MFEQLQIITKFGAISYYDTQENKPIILFIHGNSSCLEVFEHQLNCETLRENFRLIAINLPGHGTSAIPSNKNAIYNFVGYAAVIADFIEQLDLNNIIIAGWSLGGHVALELINEKNEINQIKRINGLLLTGTPPVSLKTPQEAFAGFKFNPAVAQLITKTEFSSEEAVLFIEEGGIKITERNSILVKHAIEMDGEARSLFMAWVMQGPDLDQRETLARTDISVQFVIGAEDKGINNEYLLETIEACNKIRSFSKLNLHTTVLFENVGHASFYEESQLFNKTLTSFANNNHAKEYACRLAI